MAEHIIDIQNGPRADQFSLFRPFQKPHFAVTARVDISHLMARRVDGVAPYRACLYAIGAGLHAVPELCMRLRGDQVVRHDRLTLSMTVPLDGGGFGLGYVLWEPDFAAFDAAAAADIAAVRAGRPFEPHSMGDAAAYLSCLPWLDFTSVSNAMPGPDDSIPRVAWGKFVDHGQRHDMAMAIEVHHALADGEHVAAYFAAVQAALDSI